MKSLLVSALIPLLLSPSVFAQTVTVDPSGATGSFGGVTVQADFPSIPSIPNIETGAGQTIDGIFNRFLQGVQTTLNGEFETLFEGIFNPLLANGEVGALGLPDPIAVERDILEVLLSRNNSEILVTYRSDPSEGRLQANEFDRQFVRAQAGAFLGFEGQQQLAAELQGVQEAVSRSTTLSTGISTVDTSGNLQAAQALASNAQGFDNSQDVLKAIAAQQAEDIATTHAMVEILKGLSGQTTEQARVMGTVHLQAQQTQRAIQTNNLLQTNISDRLDAQQREDNYREAVTGNQAFMSGFFATGLWDDMASRDSNSTNSGGF